MTFSVQAVQGDQPEGGLHQFIILSTVPVLSDTTLIVTLTGSGPNPADLADFYQPTSMIVTIPAGSSSAGFFFQSVPDGLSELDETFTVDIGGIDPAQITGGPASGTILSASTSHLIDYRTGQGLNAGNLQQLSIDVPSGSVTEGTFDPVSGNLTYVDKVLSDVISPAGTGLPYALTDDFTVFAEVGGGGAAFGAAAFITTADGNDSVTVRAGDGVSVVSASISTGAGDDQIDIALPDGQVGQQIIDGGSGQDILTLSGNFSSIGLVGIETIRLGLGLPPATPGDQMWITTSSLDGVERIELSDMSANVVDAIGVTLSIAGTYDFSTIDFVNAESFQSDNTISSEDFLTVVGSGFNDRIAGGTGLSNAISAGDGNDEIVVAEASFQSAIYGDVGNDTLFGLHSLYGGLDDDVLVITGAGAVRAGCADGGAGSDDVYVSTAPLALAAAQGLTGTLIEIDRGFVPSVPGETDRVFFEGAAADFIDLGTFAGPNGTTRRFEYAPGGVGSGIWIDLVVNPGEIDFAQITFGATPPIPSFGTPPTLFALDFSTAPGAISFDFDNDPATSVTSATSVSVTFDGGAGVVSASDGTTTLQTTIAALAGQTPTNVTSITGTDGDDSMEVQTAQAVTLNGGLGDDTLRGGGNMQGGEGNDLLRFDESDVAAGAVADGGNGIDRLEVGLNAGFSDQSFQGVSLSSIEQVRYLQTDDLLTPGAFFSQAFQALQIGSGLSANTFWDWNGHHLTRILMGSAASVDLSGFTFSASAMINRDLAMDDPVTGYSGFNLIGGSAAETMTGSAVRDTMNGFGGNDSLNGMDGADLFYGESGADRSFGGNGDDRFVYHAASDVVAGELVDGGSGIDTLVISDDAGTGIDFRAMSYSGFVSLERLSFRNLAGPQSVTFGAVQFSAGGLDSALHWDWQAGANVTVNLVAAGGVTNIDMSGFVLEGGALANLNTSLDVLAGGFNVSGMNIVTGSAGRDRITGTAFNDVLSGGGGADILVAGLGQDQLDGGTGDDVLVGNDDTFTVLNGGDGNDGLTGSGNLYGGIGNDTLTGGAGFSTLDGGAGDDRMVSGSGINRFISNSGADTIIGNTGTNDELVLDRSSLTAAQILDFSNPLALVTLTDGTNIMGVESVTFTSGSGNDTITASSGIYGNGVFGGAGDDVLFGGTGMNGLDGGDGNDVLISGGVTNSLQGGNGNDTITLNSAGGVDGGSGDDLIHGSSANDLIYGGIGADIMDGGNGSDRYFVDDLGDQVIEAAGGGSADEVLAYLDYTLASGIEVGILTGSASHLTGNAQDNILQGNVAGGCVLDGLDGNDRIDGFGNSTIYGGFGDDIMAASAGSRLLGGDGNDGIFVGSEGNTIEGGSGNDTIIAGIGPGGTDHAVYSGARSDYDISPVIINGILARYIIQHVRNIGAQDDGTDVVSVGIDFFDFADGIVAAQDLLNPVNHIATITGSFVGALVEDAVTDSVNGALSISDPDAGEAYFQAPPSLSGSFGSFAFAPLTGVWSYVLDNTASATQALAAGQVGHDTLTVTSFDGSASQVIDITVTGVNDLATVTGWATGDLIEEGPTDIASGTLTVQDVDGGENRFQTPTIAQGIYGTFAFDAATGDWTYFLDTAGFALQALTALDVVHETLTVTSLDGTASQTIDVLIHGRNDDATIQGGATGSVSEDNPPATVSGVLVVDDIDAGENSFQLPLDLVGTYGSFTFNDQTGDWTYTLNNAGSATQSLQGGQVVHDILTVTSSDGTATQAIDIAITGTSDLAHISGSNSGLLIEDDTVQTTTGILTIVDLDAGDAAFIFAGGLAGTYGTFTFDTLTGVWTYMLDNSLAATQALAAGQSGFDQLAVNSLDGSANIGISVTVIGVNDAAVIGGATSGTVTEDASPGTASGQLSVTDVDSAASFVVVTGGGTANGYGTFAVTASGLWTYTLSNSNATVDALATGQALADSFVVTTADGTTQTISLTIQGADDGSGTPGNDVLFGTDLFDLILAGGGNDFVLAYGGSDTLFGGTGNDSLYGWTGADRLNGDDGDDVLEGGGGADAIDGGTGFDRASYALAAAGLTVDLANPGANTREAVGDTFLSIEGLIGSSFNDILRGDGAANQLSGNGGNDQLLGQAGNDTLIGDSGIDTLTGGAGADVFQFTRLTDSASVIASADRIADFQHGTDLIDLSGLDADGSVTGNNSFTFIGNAAFTALGQARFYQSGGNTYLALNTQGTTSPEMVIRLNGVHVMTGADLLL